MANIKSIYLNQQSYDVEDNFSRAAIAKNYADLTVPIKKDTLCWYNNQLYRCIIAINMNETWTSEHWASVKIGDEVEALSGRINNLTLGLSDAAKRALLACFYHVAWTDEHGQEYYNALEEALFSTMTVTLDSSSISFTSIGATAKLTANTIPAGGSITWASSDSSIATVDATGLVTSVGYGNVIITAFSGQASATCNVLVEPSTVDSLDAVYTQSGTIYPNTAIKYLKNDLVVTAYMSDSTTVIVPSSNYALSGTLTEGTSTITVSYGGKTTTFNVNVTGITLQSIEAVFNQGSVVIYDNDTLNNLKQYLTVTAQYNNGTSEVITIYELSGELIEGTTTITVSYSNKTTTFTVNVTKHQSSPTIYKLSDGTLAPLVTGGISTIDGIPTISQAGVQKVINILTGAVPFNIRSDAQSTPTASQYYPIPVPLNAMKATITVTPSTLYCNGNIRKYENGVFTILGDSQTQQETIEFNFTPSENLYFVGQIRNSDKSDPVTADITELIVKFE